MSAPAAQPDRMVIRPFSPGEEDAVVALWEDCGLVVSHNDPRRDIARKLRVNPEWFLVGLLDGRIVGSCMVGYEGHRGWINYLAVSPSLRRRGLARQLMAAATGLLREAGCPKINLQVRSSNRQVVAFYRSLGFQEDDVISFGFRLEHDQSPTEP